MLYRDRGDLYMAFATPHVLDGLPSPGVEPMAWQLVDGQGTEGEAAEDMRYMIDVGDLLAFSSLPARLHSRQRLSKNECKPFGRLRSWKAKLNLRDDFLSRVLSIRLTSREVYAFKTVRWSLQGCRRLSTATQCRLSSTQSQRQKAPTRF